MTATQLTNRYKITFDQVIYRGHPQPRVAVNVVYTGQATDCDAFQETIIGMLETMGAIHGNILSIKRN